MSAETKPPTTSDLLMTLITEIRGLRDDMRRRSGLPDVRIGKYTTRDWTGPAMEGKTASECPADFLLAYAGYLEWRAAKNREDDKKSQYAVGNEREALMCRRWAAVNRDVKAPEKPSFRRPEPKQDEPPDTQDSRRDPGQPTTETRPKWGGSSGWAKKASGS